MGEGLTRLLDGILWLTVSLMAAFLALVWWYVAAHALWEWVKA